MEKRKESGGTKRRVRGGCSALLCSARHAPGRKDHTLFFPSRRFFGNIVTFRVARAGLSLHSASRARLKRKEIPNEESVRAGIINSFNSAMELIGSIFFLPFKPKVHKSFLSFPFRRSLFSHFCHWWHILRPWCTFEGSFSALGVWRPGSESSFTRIMESGASSWARPAFSNRSFLCLFCPNDPRAVVTGVKVQVWGGKVGLGLVAKRLCGRFTSEPMTWKLN